MPKPSLCSTARVAKPVKLKTMSVGVLPFIPSSWHMQAVSQARGSGQRLQALQREALHGGVLAQAERAFAGRTRLGGAAAPH